MKKYRVGILGCGTVWDYHKLIYEKTDRFECTCVFDLSAERAAAAADFSGARVAQSAQDLLQAEDVDIVSVLTPAFTHADYVEIGAKAGKHFMLEKPMTQDFADAQRIATAIELAGVKCFHPTLRALFSDMYEKMEELTAPDGLLGPVKCGFFHYVGYPFKWANWFTDRKMCLPEAEYGSHVFDTFLALTGDKAATVWSHADRYSRDFDQDDVTTIVIRFHGGSYFQMNINWVTNLSWNYYKQDYHLACERGIIQHDWASMKWSSAEGQGEYKSKRTGTQGNRWEHYEALANAIESGADVSPNERDGLEYMRIIGAALRSRETGEVVEVK